MTDEFDKEEEVKETDDIDPKSPLLDDDLLVEDEAVPLEGKIDDEDFVEIGLKDDEDTPYSLTEDGEFSY